jgi:hypothetical protein
MSADLSGQEVHNYVKRNLEETLTWKIKMEKDVEHIKEKQSAMEENIKSIFGILQENQKFGIKMLFTMVITLLGVIVSVALQLIK